MDFCVRKAQKSDCAEIFRLIKELAEYAQTPDTPLIDARVLEEDGFGRRPFYECNVIALNENSPILVGYVLFYYTYSTIEGKVVYMKNLYVSPSHRGKGLGTNLWKSCIQAGLNMGSSRCDFTVLGWNKPSIEFYKSKGAQNLTESEELHSFSLKSKADMEAFVKNS